MNSSSYFKDLCRLLDYINTKLYDNSSRNNNDTNIDVMVAAKLFKVTNYSDNNFSDNDLLSNCFGLSTHPPKLDDSNRIRFSLVKYVYPILLVFGITGNFWSFLGEFKRKTFKILPGDQERYSPDPCGHFTQPISHTYLKLKKSLFLHISTQFDALYSPK